MIKTKKVSKGVTLLSRCGMRSLSWCRSNRYTCPECGDCTLISRYTRDKNITDEDGTVLRKCSRCGKYRPLSRYSRRQYSRGDKVYEGYRSICNFCLSEMYYERKNAALAAKNK